MGFGWGHIFQLAKRMFHINEEKIAELLGVDRSTIYRQIKKINGRFNSAVDVYTTIFDLPDGKPETEQQYYDNLRISLDSNLFPEDFRRPRYKTYRKSIEYLLKKADETAILARKKPSSQAEGNLDGIDNTPIHVWTEAKLRFQEKDTIDFESEIELETQQTPELSEPMYYGEYSSRRLSAMFDMYPGFESPAPLDPDLKEKWGSVRITDEFSKSIKNYKIALFLEIAPLDLLPMREADTADDVVNRIRSATQFVQHMLPAVDYMIISNENEMIFEDIVNFVVRLDGYLNLLRENSNNPDLFANEFILQLSDDTDLEQKINKYYDELRFTMEYLDEQLKDKDHHGPNSGQ